MAERRPLPEPATAVDSGAAVCLQELLAAQAARTPTACAVVYDGEALTYRQLDRLAGRLAGRLRALGVGPEVLVGIAAHRSLELVAGLLAVLKAGGAYVPLDPGYPDERLAFMLADSAVPVLLTQASLAERLAALAPAGVRQVLLADLEDGVAAGEPLAAAGTGPDNAAYAIYTSGSTGRPKGVQVLHRGVVNFLRSMAQRPGIGPDDVLVAVTTLCFDIAGLELFLPLLAGARVVLASRETAADGLALRRLLASSGATMMQATPASWRLLLAAGWDGSPPLRVLCGGEALPRDLADQLLARSSSVWNLYGPTETTIWSAVQQVEPASPEESSTVAIGRPIAHTHLYLVDRGLQLVPAGEPGELLIGGDGVARGYRGRPDLTAERFVPDAWSGSPGARLYRTGDLARVRAGGEVEYLGRLDHQVKIRGFRIELGEIEGALARHPAVRECAAVARTDGAGEPRLVAYYTLRPDALPGRGELRAFLARSLPDYMLPASYVRLDALPLSPNGKLDRRALPAPRRERPDLPEPPVAPRTPTESALAAIWAAAVDLDEIGVRDDFFVLGGHSLLALRVVTGIRERFGVEFPLSVLFWAPTG